VAALLTNLINELERRQPGDPQDSTQPQRREDQKSQGKASSTANTDGTPGSGSGGTMTDKEALSNWARGVWGVLPDRVRQQIQNLGDEQFLPEYAEIIRHYYDGLSQRGRKGEPTQLDQ
jgi:hypothetical protein